jgi:phage/plasmid-like protein (TIGR03299 family)
MSHQFESGFFVSEPAWHRLGKVLDNPPTTEAAIKDAGLDWRVLEEPVYTLENNEPKEILGYKSLVRDRDRSILGVVTNHYNPLQNDEAFRWFDPLLHEGDVSLEAAGSLRGGKRIWVLAKVNTICLEVQDGDVVNPYLLLHNSHDGSTAVWLQFTVIRVVCWNTLSWASASRQKDEKTGKAFRIRHSGTLKENLGIAMEALDFTRQTFTHTVEEYRAMAKKSITKELFELYVGEVLGTETPTSTRAYPQIEANFLSGRGNLGKTLWDAYNGVTEWIDYQRGRSEATRLESAWFGESAAKRAKAHSVALELL